MWGKAATKIQALWRGVRARLQLMEVEEEKAARTAQLRPLIALRWIFEHCCARPAVRTRLAALIRLNAGLRIQASWRRYIVLRRFIITVRAEMEVAAAAKRRVEDAHKHSLYKYDASEQGSRSEVMTCTLYKVVAEDVVAEIDELFPTDQSRGSWERTNQSVNSIPHRRCRLPAAAASRRRRRRRLHTTLLDASSRACCGVGYTCR